MIALVILLVLCSPRSHLCSGTSNLLPELSLANPPEGLLMTKSRAGPAPANAPKHHENTVNATSKHHHHLRVPHASSPTSSARGQDCDGVTCTEPLTSTPIGSPCGCVLPIQVAIDLGVAPYLLLTDIVEFAVEMATGTFLKQSQVKIMAAVGLVESPEKTRVTIYLVPLGEKFDTTTAMLIYERLWRKEVPLNISMFGDYEVIYVQYPGLPSSPPFAPGRSNGLGPASDGNHPIQYPFTADIPTNKSHKLNSEIIAVIVASSLTLILACIGIILFILKWKRFGQQPAAISSVSRSFARRSGIRSVASTGMGSSLSASVISAIVSFPPPLKTFSFAELQKATNSFSSKKILGEGGFGRVYYGTMDDGSEVAVKLLSKGNRDGERDFIAEVETLSRLHHRNLVKLLGICSDGNKRCLVYELIRNGSVESHLHGADKKKGSLEWDARMRIALGAARGLAYLHEDSNPCIIHRDFKASNILLEEDFTAKVTDFGLAREASEVGQHISTQVMGTFGYVAPEYAMTGHLLVKSDVYSYGVVLLELLTGRKPVYMLEFEGPENLVIWARPLLTTREGVEQMMDPFLHGKCNLDDVARVAAIASMCVHAEASQRPFMGEVVQALKLIYNDMDESLEHSCSRKESSLSLDIDHREDFGAESSWWRSGALQSSHGHGSPPFISMEYCSGPMEELHWLNVRMEVKNKGSGPLRTKKRISLHKLRRSKSEHCLCLSHPDTNDQHKSSL